MSMAGPLPGVFLRPACDPGWVGRPVGGGPKALVGFDGAPTDLAVFRGMPCQTPLGYSAVGQPVLFSLASSGMAMALPVCPGRCPDFPVLSVRVSARPSESVR
jgi:hypothetical protein